MKEHSGGAGVAEFTLSWHALDIGRPPFSSAGFLGAYMSGSHSFWYCNDYVSACDGLVLPISIVSSESQLLCQQPGPSLSRSPVSSPGPGTHRVGTTQPGGPCLQKDL